MHQPISTVNHPQSCKMQETVDSPLSLAFLLRGTYTVCKVRGYRGSKLGSGDSVEVNGCQTREDAEEPALGEGELPLVCRRVRVAAGADVDYEPVD
ncbi:MAG: hypothetical protein JWP34_3281, partial [Massilia sp.]|nr:hypothetical protein [Massilia sp.]